MIPSLLNGNDSFVLSNLAADPATDSAYAFFSEADLNNLLEDPAEFFVGGFSAAYGTRQDIEDAFYSNFSALSADFISIGSIGVQDDDLGGAEGIVNLPINVDVTSVVNRNVAVWLSSNGDRTDSTAEHLIYWLATETYETPGVTPATYRLNLRPDAASLAVGEFGNTTFDYTSQGLGVQFAFNTVSVPEPSTIFTLLGVGLFGTIIGRRKRHRSQANATRE